MQDLNDLYFFVQVVDHRGFAPAARALNLPKSRLSRRISELEKQLGVRLIQRSTRKFSVTEIGQEYYAHARAMMLEAEAAQEVIDRTRSGPQGLIRISAPPSLVCFEVGAMIARFMTANPRVSLELLSTSRRVDPIAEGIDLALRVRFPPFEESDLVVRKLGDSSQRLVAAPGLCTGHALPLRPADLSGLPSLSLDMPGRTPVWHLFGPEGAEARVPHRPRLITDDLSQLLHAALDGVGIVQLPGMVVDSHIASGALIDILENWAPQTGVIQAVFPSRRGLLPSVRGLIDFLAAEYAKAGADIRRAASPAA